MKKVLFMSFMAICMAACTGKATEDADSQEEVTEEEVEEETSDWIVLFDGLSTTGWRSFNGESLPDNWIIEEGSLKSLGTGGDIGGDIVYGAREFENFELSLEWKISEGGNSGIFYHVKEGEQYSAAYENAPEYQVLDDIGFPEPLEDWQKVGADYGMYVPDPDKKVVKPAGEWNTSRIVFTPKQVEYWLNGVKLLSFEPWSADWNERVNTGKWAEYADYGSFRSGYFGLQDHGNVAWYRNIKVREL